MPHGASAPRSGQANRARRRCRWAAVVLVLGALSWRCSGLRSAFVPSGAPPAAPGRSQRTRGRELASLGETVVEKPGAPIEEQESRSPKEEVPEPKNEEERKERFEILCVTMLQLSDKAEEMVLSDELPAYVDFPAFMTLLHRVQLDASAGESRRLFDMLARSGETVHIPAMRRNIRESGTIGEMYSDSLKNVALTVIPALGAAAAFAFFKGPSSGLDFLTGYIVEDSLSIDNLFVFLLLFQSFKVPPRLQTFCLNLGIYGAVVLRAIFIFAGLAAVESFKPLLLFFSAFLVSSSFTALTKDEEADGEEDGPPEFVTNIVAMLPTTPNFVGEKLFIEGPKGNMLATPLALCILSIELCDILFAVDSVPAVFAVTEDPLIVYTSNIAAILGLRSLFRVLSVAVQDLVYLEKAVAIVLGFVGVKLCAEVFGVEINSAVSLALIVLTLAGGVFFSKLADSQKPEKESPRENEI